MEFIFYPGCLISYRFPFIEKITKELAEKLDIRLKEITQFTCCPDPQGLQSYDMDLWVITAARNMALANQANLDIFTICNGCYSTFRKVSSLLEEDYKLLYEVNEKLGQIGLEYRGNSKIYHINELILRKIGLKKIEQAITIPLKGLKVAIHYGCHLTRPSTIVEFNDNRKPETLERIIKTLGASVVEYEGEDRCCGGSLNFINELNSLKFAQKKLLSIQQANADCIAVVCPYCYLQLEISQIKLQKQNLPISLPILHLSELMGMAFGIKDVKELVKMHKIKPGDRFDKYWTKSEDIIIDEHFSTDLLKNCAKCRACSQDCSLIDTIDFDPLKYVDLVLAGKIKEAIEDEGIWYCLNCYGCLEKCPQRMGLAHFFMKLRNIANSSGKGLDSINMETKKVLKEGSSTGKLMSLRRKLKLPPNIMGGIDDLNKILDPKKKMDVET